MKNIILAVALFAAAPVMASTYGDCQETSLLMDNILDSRAQGMTKAEVLAGFKGEAFSKAVEAIYSQPLETDPKLIERMNTLIYIALEFGCNDVLNPAERIN